jgi:hypothetical protein
MTRGSTQLGRTTDPSHTSVVARSLEEKEAIKAGRRKQMNKFGARETTYIASLTRAAPVKLFGLMPQQSRLKAPASL